jgi:hypothetical protein
VSPQTCASRRCVALRDPRGLAHPTTPAFPVMREGIGGAVKRTFFSCENAAPHFRERFHILIRRREAAVNTPPASVVETDRAPGSVCVRVPACAMIVARVEYERAVISRCFIPLPASVAGGEPMQGLPSGSGFASFARDLFMRVLVAHRGSGRGLCHRLRLPPAR